MIIVLAEFMQVVSVIVWTFGGAWVGRCLNDVAIDHGYLATGWPKDNLQAAAYIAGGVVGFAISATGAAIVFAFAQIELNTRDIARYYIERRKSEAAIARAMK
jgi:hypothetical protein